MLEAIKAAVQDGHVDGLVYGLHVRSGHRRIGAAGMYRRCPEKAMQAVLDLKKSLQSDDESAFRLSQ